MRNRLAALALFALLPLSSSAQEAQPPTPPPAFVPPPPQDPPQPQGPHTSPPQYPPPAQYPPPPQHAPPAQYPPSPQHAPPAQPPAPGLPAQRQRAPWYAAFAIGGGDGSIRLANVGTRPERTASLHDFFGKGPVTFSFDLDVGATLSPKWLVGGELTYFIAAASHDTPFGTAAQSLVLSNINGVLTFYPFDRGLFVRGGLGVASLGYASEVPNVTGAKTKTTRSARGADLALGAGYAFWLGQRFNLSMNVDWSRQLLAGDDFEGASFWRLGLGFGWY